jgi:hypothetical protein
MDSKLLITKQNIKTGKWGCIAGPNDPNKLLVQDTYLIEA